MSNDQRTKPKSFTMLSKRLSFRPNKPTTTSEGKPVRRPAPTNRISSVFKEQTAPERNVQASSINVSESPKKQDPKLERSATTMMLSPKDDIWKPIQVFGTVLQSFIPQGKYQVRLHIGDKVKIQEQCGLWYKGIVLTTDKKGIFPKSFVAISKKLYHNEDDAMKELQLALWDWVSLSKMYFGVSYS